MPDGEGSPKSKAPGAGGADAGASPRGPRGQGEAGTDARDARSGDLARPGIRRITAKCLEDKTVSLRVLEKLGMRRVGFAGATLRFEL
jgi:hypothetical protein